MLSGKKEKKSFSFGTSDKSIKRQAITEEKKMSIKLKGRLTPASGAIASIPADIIVDKTLLVDVKSAIKSKQIIVDETMLDKIDKESLRMGRNPVILLNFPKSQLRYKQWVVIPLEDYNALRE